MSRAIANRKPGRPHSSQQGATLIELIVAMAAGLIILASAVSVFRQAMIATDLLTQRAIMQQNARAGINQISHDLLMAATGLPAGGIGLPNGGSHAKFACDSTTCYVTNNSYPNDRMYALTPGPGKGVNAENGSPTDVLTIVYADPSINLTVDPAVADPKKPGEVNNNITPSGNQVTFDATTSPSVDDPAFGLTPGDIVVLSNQNGAAAGEVTNVTKNSNKVDFSSNDPLNINQPGVNGTISALSNSGSYPATRAFRILPVTYFLQLQTDGSKQLMRQVGGHPPVPLIDNVVSISFSYDIYDETSSTATADLSDANGQYNSIRKINVSLTVRSPKINPRTRQHDYFSLNTSVAPRSMGFKDVYQ
jgi:type IV pilus assembly protein PilW